MVDAGDKANCFPQQLQSLELSGHTVSNHVRHIYDKLNVANAPAAITRGFNSGILGPSKKNRERNP